MPRYLISFDAHAMDHIPAEEMPAVGDAAHEVVREAQEAGVWVFAGGLEDEQASIVAIDGTVAEGLRPEAVGGLCVVDVPSREDIGKVVVTREVVSDNVNPTLVPREDEPKKKKSA